MYKRILVPVDGSGASLRGLDEAVSIVKATDGEIRVLHVVDGIAFAKQYNIFTATAHQFRESGKKLIEQVMEDVSKRKVRAQAVIVENASAADSIAKEAKKWRADLIVMGTHGRRGINRLVLGSDAEILLRIAPVPVLLVRSSRAPRRGKKKR